MRLYIQISPPPILKKEINVDVEIFTLLYVQYCKKNKIVFARSRSEVFQVCFWKLCNSEIKFYPNYFVPTLHYHAQYIMGFLFKKGRK